MKKLLLTCLLSASLLPARSQLFSPEAFSGAAMGALIGGAVGGSSYSRGCGSYNSFSGQGAAIGAGIGLLAGALVGEANQRAAYAEQPVAPMAVSGYGYGSAYTYYAPNAYTAPGYYYRPNRPNYAVGGTLLGAASGALIGAGNNQAGKGAAIGAAAGLVLGSVAQLAAKNQEQKLVAAQTTPQPVSVAAMQDSRPQTQDSSAQITSQPVATSTYQWAPRPQIPDAARVPDAPTF
jgi:outer membrane lipoprotein SlyB